MSSGVVVHLGPWQHPHLGLPPLAMQAVIAKLDEMMGCDPAYILPSIEALANLCLTPDQQVGLGAGVGGRAARWLGCCRVCRGVAALAPWATPLAPNTTW